MKHDENKDLKSFSRIGKVDYSAKVLQCSKNATIGIHLWGRIDYLTHHCGWVLLWNNSITVNSSPNNNVPTENPKKKIKKELKPTNKAKKK